VGNIRTKTKYQHFENPTWGPANFLFWAHFSHFHYRNFLPSSQQVVICIILLVQLVRTWGNNNRLHNPYSKYLKIHVRVFLFLAHFSHFQNRNFLPSSQQVGIGMILLVQLVRTWWNVSRLHNPYSKYLKIHVRVFLFCLILAISRMTTSSP
jgi:hypothetical protein